MHFPASGGNSEHNKSKGKWIWHTQRTETGFSLFFLKFGNWYVLGPLEVLLRTGVFSRWWNSFLLQWSAAVWLLCPTRACENETAKCHMWSNEDPILHAVPFSSLLFHFCIPMQLAKLIRQEICNVPCSALFDLNLIHTLFKLVIRGQVWSELWNFKQFHPSTPHSNVLRKNPWQTTKKALACSYLNTVDVQNGRHSQG